MNSKIKQKVKSRLPIVIFAMFGLFIAWISDASASPNYFNNFEGCSDAGCHVKAAVGMKSIEVLVVPILIQMV